MSTCNGGSLVDDDDSATLSPSTKPSSTPLSPTEALDAKIDDDLTEELQGKGLDKALLEEMLSIFYHDGEAVTSVQDSSLQEVLEIISPILPPNMFKYNQSLPEGLLLIGTPGADMTLIGKAVARLAHNTRAMFFSISASSLTSSWIEVGEKMVKALFVYLAVCGEPSIVFLDNVDSLLSHHSEGETGAASRMKTELFIQLERFNTNASVNSVIFGATNRPDELNEAARLLFQKQVCIPPLDDLLGKKLLEMAAKGMLKEVGELLELGADPNALGKDTGMTPLHFASHHGYLKVVKLLVDRGADLNAKSHEDHMTPLHMASLNGQLEVVKLLVDRGADPEARTNRGDTPLTFGSLISCYAAMDKQIASYEVVQFLSMYTGITSQHKLIWAATWMEHLIVYHVFRGTQVVTDLYEYLG